MSRSIKLKNNTYWDMSSIRYGLERVQFSVPSNGTKTLTFTTNASVFLLTGKTTLSSGCHCWLIFTYGSGDTRTKIQNLYENGHLSLSVNGQTITVSNSSSSTYTCTILFLIGDHKNMSIS